MSDLSGVPFIRESMIFKRFLDFEKHCPTGDEE